MTRDFSEFLLPSQLAAAEAPPSKMLLVAPAGCGKTETLAARIALEVTRGGAAPPRKVLGITFSNRARDNLLARLRSFMSRRALERVTVTNFHGLAARLVRSHGATVGVDREVQLPTLVRYRLFMSSLGLDYQTQTAALDIVRGTKCGAASDDEVMERLASAAYPPALRYELALRAAHLIDYDDLIRHGLRTIRIPAIATLYQEHFSAIVVDEVQDLTLDQFELVETIASGNVTYAGDPAQGIYAFSGAAPDAVFASIRSTNPVEMHLSESFRSSPAVLACVNALAREMGASELICARPERWPTGGTAELIVAEDPAQEAVLVLDRVNALIGVGQSQSIGIISRRGNRLSSLKEEASRRGLVFEDWSAASRTPEVISLLLRHKDESLRWSAIVDEQLQRLEQLVLARVEGDNLLLQDEFSSIFEELRAAVNAGSTLSDALSSYRSPGNGDGPIAPGLHLLTGHAGKGQEFDVVVVIGLEEGHVPDFRSTTEPQRAEELRVLHVMATRARTALMFTRSRVQLTRFGPRPVAQSPWWSILESATSQVIAPKLTSVASA